MHTIRLRQPWQPRWLEAPATAQGLRLASYRRAFNCPTGLAPQQSLSLAIQQLYIPPDGNPHEEPQSSDAEHLLGSGVVPAAELEFVSVTLNEQPLALIQPARDRWQADLTGSLLSFNQVEIVVQLAVVAAPPPPLTDLFAVQLEIA